MKKLTGYKSTSKDKEKRRITNELNRAESNN